MARFLHLCSALLFLFSATAEGTRVCIVGGGIAGASLAHFLKDYGEAAIDEIIILEKNSVVGGRMATATLAGDTFEAGATVIHRKNLHALNFTSFLGLTHKPKSSSWLGIWNGSRFVFQTLPPPKSSSPFLYKKLFPFLNSLLVFRRYGLSLLRMRSFVERTVGEFMNFYKELGDRPIFESPEEMLKWSGLHGLTKKSLREELALAGLSPLLISELVTVITRINYGQSVDMSGLAGAVGLAGSDSGLWAVDGGNWQIAAGLIERSNATLNLGEEIVAVEFKNGEYELESKAGNRYFCRVAVIATPLDEVNVSFSPPISIPRRSLQHTHVTFIRGLVNPAYFGLESESDVPDLVGTMEIPEIPFSSITIQKSYGQGDKAYRIFSRRKMEDSLLNQIFRERTETVRIDWAAYPRYNAPEEFASFVLDGLHLYYVNSFESAASTIETSAVAAENVARLILSRLLDDSDSSSNVIRAPSRSTLPHLDL
ncbi:farnesylcysteine lyase [Wolffia australiana]